MTAGLLGCAGDATPMQSPTIVIDGGFTDWESTPAAGDLNAVADGRHLWIHLRLATAPVSLQNLDVPWTLELDFDDTSIDDMRIVFSPEEMGRGVGLESIRNGSATDGSPYDVGFLFAPTIASSEFEMRLDAATDAGGTVSLEPGPDGPTLRTRFEPGSAHRTAQSTALVANRPPGTLRIVSWNVLYGRLLHEPERSARILTALDPDILLLQELEDQQTTRQVADFLNTTLGPDPVPWNVTASPIGSGLRSMAAARGGVRLDEGRPILQLDDPDRFLRAAIIGVPIPDHGMLLASSVHLRCCGTAGDEADMQRIAEAMSLARAIDGIVNAHEQRRRRFERAVAEPTSTSLGIGSIVVGGDLNLVGSRVPLDVLTAPRHGGGGMAAAQLLHLDGSSNATWSDASSSFTPGRLDYMLYSPVSLLSSGGFILDTTRLDPRQLESMGIQADDTTLSDHAPLVLDLRPAPR